MGYDSKYTGQQVEELLEKASTALQSVPDEYVTATELEGKGYATTEAVNTSLAEKVDKVAGKQLTTEDFTTALKQKLEGLSNYDDTTINEAVNTLRKDFDTLVSGDSTTAIKTFNEIIAFLSGIEDSESLDSIIASIEQQIAAKQDTIADLATIREGAGKGATAVQPSSLAKVATSGSYADLSDKPTIPAAVTVDTALSTTSTNPVQNKAVAAGINAKYTKPSAGIPKSDLAAAVQNSLGKADTALQTEQYKGTVTGVKINGTTKNPSNGVVDLGTVITSHQTLKTINGESIVGSGDITISGGSSDSNVQAVDTGDVIDDVNVDYATKTYVDGLVGDINSVLENIING